jgi:predicted transcriptional regulator
MIKNMPQNISVEDIMAELYFRYEVDQGLKQLNEGKGIPHEEVEKRMKKFIL